MKQSSPLLLSSAILAALCFLAVCSQPALATTYDIYDLGNANGTNLYGIDSTGAVVLYNGMCAVSSISCFETYVDGTGVSGSTTSARAEPIVNPSRAILRSGAFTTLPPPSS